MAYTEISHHACFPLLYFYSYYLGCCATGRDSQACVARSYGAACFSTCVVSRFHIEINRFIKHAVGLNAATWKIAFACTYLCIIFFCTANFKITGFSGKWQIGKKKWMNFILGNFMKNQKYFCLLLIHIFFRKSIKNLTFCYIFNLFCILQRKLVGTKFATNLIFSSNQKSRKHYYSPF